MREIKFRGKKYSGEWIIGSLLIQDGRCHIFPETAPDSYDNYQVTEATVGQYTGLKDKNGVEIFEGDLLRRLPESQWDIENFTAFEVFFHDGDAHMDHNIGWSMCRTHHKGAVCGGLIPGFKPTFMRLGDGARVTLSEAIDKYKISISELN